MNVEQPEIVSPLAACPHSDYFYCLTIECLASKMYLNKGVRAVWREFHNGTWRMIISERRKLYSTLSCKTEKLPTPTWQILCYGSLYQFAVTLLLCIDRSQVDEVNCWRI